MNFQQLEYIIAVDEQKHFLNAADKCSVTQATLSAMIKKLELELNVQVFDRSSLPVKTTKEGKEIIARARQIIAHYKALYEFAKELKEEVSGSVTLGIIPTLSPYLLPLFLNDFSKKHPNLKIDIWEQSSGDILKNIEHGSIDIGVMATPSLHAGIIDIPLFYEELCVYASSPEALRTKKNLMPKDLDPQKIWLLEDEHCLRQQAINFCELKNMNYASRSINYKVGSIETLINLVDSVEGITILPKLATIHLSGEQQKKMLKFSAPQPAISLVTSESYSRKAIIKSLEQIIGVGVKGYVSMSNDGFQIVGIH